jgi:hypothetical protein
MIADASEHRAASLPPSAKTNPGALLSQQGAFDGQSASRVQGVEEAAARQDLDRDHARKIGLLRQVRARSQRSALAFDRAVFHCLGRFTEFNVICKPMRS